MPRDRLFKPQLSSRTQSITLNEGQWQGHTMLYTLNKAGLQKSSVPSSGTSRVSF